MAENENMERSEATAAGPSKAPAKKGKNDKKPEKKKKPGVLARVKGWWKETRAELKKVQWPTRKQTVNNTLIVLAFCVVVGVCIFLFDLLATNLFNAIITLVHG